MALSILIWWLVIQLFALAGLPLAAFLFRALPDRGYAQAKALGLLVVGYGAWLLAMLGLGSFGAPLLIVVLLFAGGVGWYGVRGRGLLPFLRARWRLVLGYEALFLVALILMALVRSTNMPGITSPDPWGTEKPMDFAFFNAIQRSPQFPPLDPWLSGYSINYYYFGYLLMASVALLSGLDPAVAFNLSLSLIFALTALGIAGLVWNLIALSTERRRPEVGRAVDEHNLDADHSRDADTGQSEDALSPPQATAERTPLRDHVWRAAAAALAVMLVLVAGNLAGASQIFLGDERAVALDTNQFLTAASQVLAGSSTVNLPTPLLTDEWKANDGSNIITYWEHKPADQSFSWWWTSRSLWDTRDGVRRYAITEFPAFSFQLGDMHPHLLALPFTLLALALALATLVRPTAPSYGGGRAGWADLLLTGLVLGCLYVINTWDLPSYALLFAGALTLLFVRLDAGQGRLLWKLLLQQLAVVAAASLILFGPFYLTFRSFAGSEATINIPLLSSFSKIVGFMGATRSELHSFLLIFGLLLLPVASFVLAGPGRGGRRARGGLAASGFYSPLPSWEPEAAGGEGGPRPPTSRLLITASRLLAFGPWIILGSLVVGFLVNFQLLFLLPLGMYAFGLALRRPEDHGPAFALLAAALGCFISFGTELIYIRDVFEGWQPRFNTIFKFYYQVWLIWGCVAAYSVWWLYTGRFSWRRPGGYLFAALFLVLLGAALVYPQQTVLRALREGERVGLLGRNPRDRTPAGAASIAWLRSQTPDGSVILEAEGNAYDTSGEGAAQVSGSSGLPTVLGWRGHEGQWRNGDPQLLEELDRRQRDVDAIYSTSDPAVARELLAKYNVRYIYIGTFERQKYPDTLGKFDQIASPVFQQDEVTIYMLEN